MKAKLTQTLMLTFQHDKTLAAKKLVKNYVKDGFNIISSSYPSHPDDGQGYVELKSEESFTYKNK